MKLDWSDRPVVLIGGGPSLTQEQVDYAASSVCYILAINNAYQICPTAHALYACDKKWWEHYKPDFDGNKYSLEYNGKGVFKLKNTGQSGIDLEWPGVRTGRNSGYQALNLAVHFGCKKIILIGYDMKHSNNKKHWHPDHPRPLNNFPLGNNFEKFFIEAAPTLKSMGIEVINCSLDSALNCFPKANIGDVL